jgi:hypothetical protein
VEFDLFLFMIVLSVGCLLGAAMLPLVVHLNDSQAIEYPWGNLLLFSVWQTGTLLSIEFCRHRPIRIVHVDL